ncbi:response regulator transcription factor [Fluviispira multicolorata]|uniref:response regulator transcription factor n=1 Tax=Fluviispira multicolorata TaxID=2654512 RepID=UPI0013756FAE|nr:response regulator [Fluviispira multicolorata]
MKKKKILILEDNEDFRSSLSLEFEDKGFEVIAIENMNEIPEIPLNYAVVDLRLKNDNGLQCIEKIHKLSPSCRIVMLTGYPSLATAVQAMKKGAVNYLTKPINLLQLEKALFEEEFTLPNQVDPIQNSSPSLARHEREYIEYVLAECQGNITSAAKKLGLHRQSLQRKLKKYPPRK